MLKYLLLFYCLSIPFISKAQTDTLSKEDKRLLDSMFNNDEFIKLMTKKDKNYLDVSIGIGNGSFSENNNAANATEIKKQLVYTPAITYRLKNGLNFGIAAFITADSAGKPQFYQAGLTAGYDYFGKKLRAGASYTRYVSNRDKYNSKSLYQNDLFGYIKLAKGILQPGLNLGYVSGKYKETRFVTAQIAFPNPNAPPDTIYRTVSANDSTDNTTSYFSVSATVGHDFIFYNVFAKKDELDFIPTLILNMGSDKLTQTHTNKIFNRRFFSRRKNASFSNKFQAQSVAASLDLTYMVNKFFIKPVIYFDYYLPETTENRFSTIFSVTTGFSF